MPQELQAGLVCPLQIVQHQHDRLSLRHLAQQSDDRGEEQVTLSVRIVCLRRWQLADSARQRRNQPRQFRTVRVHMGNELLFGGVRDVIPQSFGEQLIWRGEIFLAMPEQHTRAEIERGAGDLGDQRRLAETGFTRDEDDLASFATGDTLERVQH